ncbi:hypothetical protein LTS15_010133 [Exophiala xenobiotica]|nr:hypothetical protein LTS15_010133 [Exophiala xenobiotica]
MILTSPIAIGAAALVLLGILIHNVGQRTRLPSGARLPPGPKGKPLVGNLLDIPPQHSWLKFKSWADQYGPIFRLNIFGRNHVVVSTEKIANDLLRERGNLYSSREQLPMAARLMSRNLRPLLLPYGELWRRGRKVMHTVTMHAAATSYQPAQLWESERLLHDLLRMPENYELLFERYAGALVMRLGYGKKMETGEEPYARDILKVVHTVERVASPGAYLVDTFPILMLLPKWLAPFKQEAERLHDFEIKLFSGLLFEVRAKMRDGKAPKCFAKTFLERQAEFGLSDDEGAYVIGTLFEAGAGTTAAAMMSFVLSMCHYPEWQQKIQQEVDQVVGNERMPDFSDIPQLPTVRAVAKETLRWRPVTAGGVPHELIKDDVYDGFFFPAGTNVHANQWAIHRDPDLYPDPETFNPSRWLSPEYPTFREPLDKFPNLQNFSAFGFGRRICPGMNLAENSLHLLIARMAWATKISKRPGIDVPLYDYTAGFNVQPKPFVFDLKPRNQARKNIVDKLWENGKNKDPLGSA